MKKVMLFTTLVALLAVFIGASMIKAEDDRPVGFDIGIGHIDYPGLGLAEGHEKHDCDPTCPICGGYPCIPPCKGPETAEPESEDNSSVSDMIGEYIWNLLYGETIR